MEDMNLTEMVNNAEMEVPTTGTETGKGGSNLLATAMCVGGVIGLWEGAKWLGKKVYGSAKKVFKKKSKDEPQTAEETVEEENVD